jgi:hypothetical protein
MRKLSALASVLLAFSMPAFSQQDPWQGTDLYKRTLVAPDSPRAGQLRPLYTWRDGSQHTITEPPPPLPKYRPPTGPATGQNLVVKERNAPRDRQQDTSQQGELGTGETDPRFCATHARTASAMDRCVRAQNGERQAEDYHWVPGPITGTPPRAPDRGTPNCGSLPIMSRYGSGCQW